MARTYYIIADFSYGEKPGYQHIVGTGQGKALALADARRRTEMLPAYSRKIREPQWVISETAARRRFGARAWREMIDEWIG